ncbi:acetylxylan esterase [Sphingobacterium lactis]|uniref:acetylxylan esterase n=1 Tax=Sphingobacterium lactis TaxID=797291 RepID=UPI003EC707A4
MKNNVSVFLFLLGMCFHHLTYAQTVESKFQQPLKEVLDEIEERFQVTIKYNDNQVEGKVVTYAFWRFRPDVDLTLQQVLAPLDMKVNKEGPGRYKLKEFEYHRWKEEDGWAFLQHLSSQYNDRSSWELRRDSLIPALRKALKLDPLPAIGNTKPILSKKRQFNGYSVENFALELLPGVYVNGSIYRPLKYKGKVPVVLSPDGHWGGHRFRKDAQIRFGMLAKMGMVAVSYDLFAWGESLLQFKSEDHQRSLALTYQILSGIRILDFMLSDPSIDRHRVGICGGSGGGNQAGLLTAIEPRITLSIPVISLSSYHFGGCPCESGLPIHAVGKGTNNVEIAAMAAPRPMLVVSDGKDWTAHAQEHDFPYLKRVYGFYNAADQVANVHLTAEGHDFGYNKRKAVYDFLIQHFNLEAKGIKQKNGEYDESSIVVEEKEALYSFGANGELLPKNAIKGYDKLEKLLP